MRQNTRLIALLWTLTAASLAGCPSPPEATSKGGGQAMGAPPGGGAPGGNAGGPPPGGPPAGGDAAGAAKPPGEAGGGGATPPTPGAGPDGDNLSVPAFKDHITGESITITVNVKGGKKGQIDFMLTGENPTALHVEPFEGEGPFEIEAPAKLDDAIHVLALNYGNGESLGQGDEIGALAKPLKLKGSDVTISLTMGEDPPWLEKMDGDQAPPPKPPPPSAGGKKVPHTAPGTGPEGGQPAGGDKAPADGAPPADGAGGGPPPGGDAGAPPPGGDAGAPPQ